MSEVMKYWDVRNRLFLETKRCLATDEIKLLAGGYSPKRYHPGEVFDPSKVDFEKHLVRLGMQPVASERAGHRIATVAPTDTFNETGIFSIEFFAPRSKGSSNSVFAMEKIANIVKKHFRNNRIYGSLWTKASTPKHLDSTANSFRMKLLVEYRYLED